MEQIDISTITAEELAELAEFRAEKARKAHEALLQNERDAYNLLVYETVDKTITKITRLNKVMTQLKANILPEFMHLIAIKKDIIGLKHENQKSNTFMNKDCTARVRIGVYTMDTYRDMAEDGCQIIREEIEDMVNDNKTRALVSTILELLSKNKKGELKAQQVLKLRTLADELNNDRILEGVKIIEQAHVAVDSKIYIRCEQKDELGEWQPISTDLTNS